MSNPARNAPQTTAASRDSAVERVGIIGAGVMGRGIAAAGLERGIPVILADADPRALEAAAAELVGSASAQHRQLLTATKRSEDFARADAVVEAITEKLPAKQQVLAAAELHVGPNAILASNTSSIPIAKIAERLRRPQQFCGMHFCHPVSRRPLVEIVRGAQTSAETVARATEFARQIGKSPIVVADCPGFVVNRLLSSYLNESMELLLDGAEPETIEAAARAFGMPIGPLRQFDEYGIDVAVRTGALLRAAYSDRFVASELPVALYGMGRLGRKAGAGFYTYRNSVRQRSDEAFNESPVGPLDAEIRRIIDERRRGHLPFSPGEITMRLFLPMLVEATRILEEQVVRDAAEIDDALAGGLGFRPLEGGLLRWADTVGLKRIVESLKPFEPLGKRYEATQLLLELAGADRTLVAPVTAPLPSQAA